MFDINTATLQEAADYAVQMIVKQGGQCMSERGACVYDNGEGLHCAFGWLLPKDNDDIIGSDATAYQIIRWHSNTLQQVITENADVMNKLQEFHDTDYQDTRTEYSYELEGYGIDTSGEWFQQWIAMGEVQ